MFTNYHKNKLKYFLRQQISQHISTVLFCFFSHHVFFSVAAFSFIDFHAKEEDEGMPEEVKQKYMLVKDLGRLDLLLMHLTSCNLDQLPAC